MQNFRNQMSKNPQFSILADRLNRGESTFFNPNDFVITVTASIKNGAYETFAQMVVDTGATYTLISNEVAKKINLKVTGTKKIAFHSASGSENAPVVRVEQLALGKSTIKNLRVIIHDLPEGAKIDGLLGLNFLRNFRVTFDFKNGKLTLQ